MSYLDLSISIVSNKYGITIYDKRDTFNFKIVIFPSMSSNIPVKPTYGISQLLRISRICDNYKDFVEKIGN